jgi:hypothetical protein
VGGGLRGWPRRLTLGGQLRAAGERSGASRSHGSGCVSPHVGAGGPQTRRRPCGHGARRRPTLSRLCVHARIGFRAFFCLYFLVLVFLCRCYFADPPPSLPQAPSRPLVVATRGARRAAPFCRPPRSRLCPHRLVVGGAASPLPPTVLAGWAQRRLCVSPPPPALLIWRRRRANKSGGVARRSAPAPCRPLKRSRSTRHTSVPDPTDASISKRGWEKRVQFWRPARSTISTTSAALRTVRRSKRSSRRVPTNMRIGWPVRTEAHAERNYPQENGGKEGPSKAFSDSALETGGPFRAFLQDVLQST